MQKCIFRILWYLLTTYNFAADLIKKQESESDEPRPLYMDFQATTPMVTITPMLVFLYRY